MQYKVRALGLRADRLRFKFRDDALDVWRTMPGTQEVASPP